MTFAVTCGHSRGQQVRTESEESQDKICAICHQAARIGRNLTQWDWMRPAGSGDATALGVNFTAVAKSTRGAFRVGRRIPRHPDGSALLFREIAEQGRGDHRLAVLKADVDDMGVWVGKIASADNSYGRLRDFSRCLHSFFVDRIQELLAQSHQLIYTIYAGGDDLLLVGPWNNMLDFAGDLQKEFQSGPGQEYSLTLPGQEYSLTFSAGIHLTPHGVPIRHAVDRAEELLEQAKKQEGKNRCAALGTVWQWDRHSAITGDGKRLAEWVEGPASRFRSLLHRLLQLSADNSVASGLRAARWSYQLARNLPQRGNESPEAAALRDWARGVLPFFDEPPGFIPYVEEDRRATQKNNQRLDETAASLRYALLATRRARD